MKHLKTISVHRASEAKQDAFGMFFLQIWLTVMGLIIGKIGRD
jgi:hypothetical protein